MIADNHAVCLSESISQSKPVYHVSWEKHY